MEKLPPAELKPIVQVIDAFLKGKKPDLSKRISGRYGPCPDCGRMQQRDRPLVGRGGVSAAVAGPSGSGRGEVAGVDTAEGQR